MSRFILCGLVILCTAATLRADELPVIEVEGQPLGANVTRLLAALEMLGTPLEENSSQALRAAAKDRDSRKLQQLLDPHVLVQVEINPESRVKVRRGPAAARLQQGGYTPVLIKVANQSTVTKPLRISSPQAGPPYAGVAPLSLQRQDQIPLGENNSPDAEGRFLSLELFTRSPLTDRLSGLEAEYALALIYSSESGKREATLSFDVGQGTQDLGFRGEVPVLFTVRPARRVKLKIQDADGKPTAARLEFRDAAGHVYPPQARRLAPDFFFQPQIYREDGQTVLLPPGKFSLISSRGPEYVRQQREVTIPAAGEPQLTIELQRWADPMRHGFYCGDHHIHAAGCAHYNSPTEGVAPEDMLLQVKGEGLNVGCVLTWGPCFDYQRRFFAPRIDKLSEPLTVLKYDLEISGFGSQALGHVCLLNLKDQTFPGSEGTKDKGWPKWTTPVLKWAKQQGAVTGYAHSASGLAIDAAAASRRLFFACDTNSDGEVTPEEAAGHLLPLPFTAIDRNRDKRIDEAELIAAHQRAAEQLPNLAIPEMNGVGAMELCVTVTNDLCDFISAMDTPRIQEWNTWYHVLNCGYPLKVSGETDFPCMSSRRVGQGRVYVHLGQIEKLDFAAWCQGIAQGRSYVSDGYAHALKFTVDDVAPGYGRVELKQPGNVQVQALVSFAPEIPKDVATGLVLPKDGRRVLGDTVNLHLPRTGEWAQGGKRTVEIIVNGQPVDAREVPADGKPHTVEFEVPIGASSWVALRQFPQLHTNPVDVQVGGKPIRASRNSALWCADVIRQLWRQRGRRIDKASRAEAKRTFDEAIRRYEQIAGEAPTGS